MPKVGFKQLDEKTNKLIWLQTIKNTNRHSTKILIGLLKNQKYFIWQQQLISHNILQNPIKIQNSHKGTTLDIKMNKSTVYKLLGSNKLVANKEKDLWIL